MQHSSFYSLCQIVLPFLLYLILARSDIFTPPSLMHLQFPFKLFIPHFKEISSEIFQFELLLCVSRLLKHLYFSCVTRCHPLFFYYKSVWC